MTNHAIQLATHKPARKVATTSSITIPHHFLLILLAVCFGGVAPLLGEISRTLLYSFYLLCFISAGLTYTLRDKTPTVFGGFGLYAYWLALYFIYGSLVSVDQSIVLPQVARAIARTVMLFSMLSSGVRTKQDIKLLARKMSVIMLIGAAVSLWMSANPEAIRAFNEFFGEDRDLGFDQIRPAGLWINPNAASFAALFYLLISCWANGKLIQLGRIAAIVIIVWSASRTGLYVLVICGIIYAIRNARFNRVALAVLYTTLIVGLLAGATTLLPQNFLINGQNASRNIWDFRIERLLDFSEQAGSRAGTNLVTRRDLVTYSIVAIQEGPIYGYGATAFQDAHEGSISLSILPTGAHNIFITILGEVSFLGLTTYLLLLGITLYRLGISQASSQDKFLVYLMFMMYCLIGLTWHNQLMDFLGIFMSGLLFLIPAVLSRTSDDQA